MGFRLGTLLKFAIWSGPKGHWVKWHITSHCIAPRCYFQFKNLLGSQFSRDHILPVGVSKHSIPIFCPTLSIAALVGILRATPFSPVLTKYGMHMALSAMTATESDGVTKNPCWPRIMLRSCRAFKSKYISKTSTNSTILKKRFRIFYNFNAIEM